MEMSGIHDFDCLVPVSSLIIDLKKTNHRVIVFHDSLQTRLKTFLTLDGRDSGFLADLV